MPRWRNWYTRTTQNRVSQGVRVRPPPEALKIVTGLWAKLAWEANLGGLELIYKLVK
jgi:hypothetical protein